MSDSGVGITRTIVQANSLKSARRQAEKHHLPAETRKAPAGDKPRTVSRESRLVGATWPALVGVAGGEWPVLAERGRAAVRRCGTGGRVRAARRGAARGGASARPGEPAGAGLGWSVGVWRRSPSTESLAPRGWCHRRPWAGAVEDTTDDPGDSGARIFRGDEKGPRPARPTGKGHHHSCQCDDPANRPGWIEAGPRRRPARDSPTGDSPTAGGPPGAQPARGGVVGLAPGRRRGRSFLLVRQMLPRCLAG